MHLKEKAREFFETGEVEYEMTFKGIEALGVRLPPSAHVHKAWWSNGNYSRPWTLSKFRPEKVDMKNRKLKFRYFGKFSLDGIGRQRAKRLRQLEECGPHPVAKFERSRRKEIDQIRMDLGLSAGAILPAGMTDIDRTHSESNPKSPSRQPRCRHPLYGALKGYIRLVAGTDLTKPANPRHGSGKP
jgi:hypothetical protein